ncbi:hypothetical protein HO173_004084 [Letharia columbiana]|uniref:Protein ZIP4 homolog n=1 Tax=Letharia columbiana TaxID=112416 RepID=A0A8H6FZX8_9LECA|nr:uncharacterized protein HO173_004084 [Letharia columbiana]KAF6237883.1 hypothetical protein HO173_004084 [Letharia columbiana]
MAPVIKRAEKENALHSILVFAKLLEEYLTSASPEKPLPADIYNKIETAVSIRNTLAACRRVDLDKRGTRLWNLSSKLKNTFASSLFFFSTALNDAPKVPLQVPIQFCQDRLRVGADMAPDDLRVLKSSLRTSRYCLDNRQLSLAEIAVERAAFYEERLKCCRDVTSQEHGRLVSRLLNEYLSLRVALAWRQGRLDIAKLMLNKVNLDTNNLELSSAEELADLFFEIGGSQSKNNQWAEAVHWLERAHNILLNQSQDLLSSDAGELRISIMHSMARALLNLESDGSQDKAWNIVRELELDCGDRLVVLLLKLEVFATDASHSAQDYCDILHKIICTVYLTDMNVKTILHHVHKLSSRSPLMAHHVLVTLLSERLLGAEETKWIEKVLITIIWNCTNSTDILDVLTSLSEVFDALAHSAAKALSPHATHAAQILLWKRIEASYNHETYDTAEAWCRLSLHPVFRSSGEVNVGKLQRKLILCALSMSDQAKAREVYSQMSPPNKKDPSTMYVLYKVALRCRDSGLAAECIDTICTASTKDATLLYACVLEAQQTGDHLQIINSLQRVLEKYSYNAPNEIHLPALLRCTARLLIRELENPPSHVTDCIDEICKLFEGAAAQARTSRRSAANDLFSLAELDWFSRNTYNLALKYCTSWSPEQTLRLVQSCLRFIGLYPAAIDLNVTADLSLRRLFCDFLCGSLLIVLARCEDNVEHQLQHYTNVRKVIDDFRVDVKGQVNRLEGGAKGDLQHKYASLLAFDYEAAARLKAWDSLDQIIKESQDFEDPKIYGLFADITLSSEAPGDGKPP